MRGTLVGGFARRLTAAAVVALVGGAGLVVAFGAESGALPTHSERPSEHHEFHCSKAPFLPPWFRCPATTTTASVLAPRDSTKRPAIGQRSMATVSCRVIPSNLS